MIVYITKSHTPELSRVSLDGLPVWRLSTGTDIFREIRTLRWLRRLYGMGVRHCAASEEALLALAEKVDITPFPVLPLRLSLLGEIVDRLLPADRRTAVTVQCGRGGEETARAAVEPLACRFRYVTLAMAHPAPLEAALLYRYGISAYGPDRPADLTVLCGAPPEAPPPPPVIWLTDDCAGRQQLLWTAPRAAAWPLPVPEALAAALLWTEKWTPGDIHVTSLLDIRPENHYNAT